MKNKASIIVNKLIDKYEVTKELIASKVHLSVRTVEMWAGGKRRPKYLAMQKLKQMLHGYRSRPKHCTKLVREITKRFVDGKRYAKRLRKEG